VLLDQVAEIRRTKKLILRDVLAPLVKGLVEVRLWLDHLDYLHFSIF
jgi:hypothetical protein